MILISACLLGRNVKYSGGNNLCPWLAKYYNTEDFTAFCPECLAMLPTPRPPVEIQNGSGEDPRRGGDHGDGADRGMIAHDVVHLPQGRGTQGVTAAGHQPSAAEGAPVGPDVGSDGVPGPGKAVAHCAHGADQGPSHDVGHIVDCLAHRGRRDAAPRLFRLQALRLCDDCLFHSTSQYSRPWRCSNRADNKN